MAKRLQALGSLAISMLLTIKLCPAEQSSVAVYYSLGPAWRFNRHFFCNVAFVLDIVGVRTQAVQPLRSLGRGAPYPWSFQRHCRCWESQAPAVVVERRPVRIGDAW